MYLQNLIEQTGGIMKEGKKVGSHSTFPYSPLATRTTLGGIGDSVTNTCYL
jgi:hypothetical protein